MMDLKKRIFIFVLLCTTIEVCSSMTQTFTQKWNLTLNQDIIINDVTIAKNNIFPYILCTEARGNDRNCTIVLEAYNMEGIIYRDTCFNHFYTKNGIEGGYLLNLRSAYDDKVAVTYLDIIIINNTKPIVELEIFLIVRIINMSTCKYHEAKIKLEEGTDKNLFNSLILEKINIVLYADDTFDIFIPRNKLCIGARCKFTYNAKGELINGPVLYLSSNLSTFNIKMFSLTSSKSPKNYYALITKFDTKLIKYPFTEYAKYPANYSDMKLVYASPSETVDLINIKDKVEAVAVDDSHNFLGICWMSKNTTVNCKQYDSIMNEKMNVTLNFTYSIKTLKVQNLQEGGLLLLTSECKDEACNEHGNVYLRNIQYNEHHGRSMLIEGLDCPKVDYEIKMEVYDELDDNLCVSAVCYGKYDSMLFRNCFPKKYVFFKWRLNSVKHL